MKLKEAEEKLSSLSNKPFGELFSAKDIKSIIKNKGKTGQLLELALGKKLSSSNLDFEDGELKTNKCDIKGNPLETICITQISSIIDELVSQEPKSFEKTRLYKKICNILYVPVCKEDKDPNNWRFLPSIHIDLTQRDFADLYDIWENDYYSICKQLKNYIETRSFIHTSSGKHIQVRSKDSKNSSGKYNPIYSDIYGRYISNKNHAFYFKKEFVYYINKIAKKL